MFKFAAIVYALFAAALAAVDYQLCANHSECAAQAPSEGALYVGDPYFYAIIAAGASVLSAIFHIAMVRSAMSRQRDEQRFEWGETVSAGTCETPATPRLADFQRGSE